MNWKILKLIILLLLVILIGYGAVVVYNNSLGTNDYSPEDDYYSSETEIIDEELSVTEEKENEEELREMTEDEAELILQIIEDAGNMFDELKAQGNPNATDITVQWLKDQFIVKDVYVSDIGDIWFEFEIGLQASILNRDSGGGGIPEF